MTIFLRPAFSKPMLHHKHSKVFDTKPHNTSFMCAAVMSLDHGREGEVRAQCALLEGSSGVQNLCNNHYQFLLNAKSTPVHKRKVP